MRHAGRKKLDDQGLSRFYLDVDLFIGTQAIEKRRRGKHAHIRKCPAKGGVFRKDFGVQQRAEQFVASDAAANFLLQRLLGGTEVDWFEIAPRSAAFGFRSP